jgi:uncharacterized protein (DUF2147 family)
MTPHVYQPSFPQPRARIATLLSRATLALIAMACAASAGTPLPAQAAPPAAQIAQAGVWLDHTGKGAIELSPCGQSLCGTIVWLKSGVDRSGKPLTDTLNPSASKRRQPICGLQIIGGLVQQRDGSWDKGKIYDPEKGQSFDLAIETKDVNHLVIIGYEGLRLFSERYVWTRVPADRPITPCQHAPAALHPAPPPPR